MVSARTSIDYIKPNLEIYGQYLDRYLDELKSDGRSKCGIESIKANIRRFLARCPPTNPEDVTADLMMNVLSVMKDDNINQLAMTQSMIHMGRFVKYITGYNPYNEIDPNSREEWFEGHMGIFPFSHELEVFIEHQKNRALLHNTLRIKKIHITISCRVLNREKGVTRLDQIDEDCFKHIHTLTTCLSKDVQSAIIFHLNEFVKFFTSKSISTTMKRRELEESRGYRDSEEWREFVRLVNGYLEDQVERGLRPQSIESMRYTMYEAYQLLVERFGPVAPKDIDYHHIRYLRNNMRDMKQITIQTYLGRLGKMLEFWFGINPYRQADLVWSPETVERTWIFKDQWKILWDSADETERVVLALGGGMGLRRVEILRIKLEDIQGNILTVHGKGHGTEGKVVTMEMPPTVQKCILEYLSFRKSVIETYGDYSNGSFLIMTKRGRGSAATVGCIQKIMCNLSEKTMIHVTCHSLRRFYCMSMVDAGTEIDTVRRMMRHESATTTYESYIYADPRKMASATKTIESSIFG